MSRVKHNIKEIVLFKFNTRVYTAISAFDTRNILIRYAFFERTVSSQYRLEEISCELV